MSPCRADYIIAPWGVWRFRLLRRTPFRDSRCTFSHMLANTAITGFARIAVGTEKLIFTRKSALLNIAIDSGSAYVRVSPPMGFISHRQVPSVLISIVVYVVECQHRSSDFAATCTLRSISLEYSSLQAEMRPLCCRDILLSILFVPAFIAV